MKNLQELMDYVRGVEREVAYGSETIWWGQFLDDLWVQYPATKGHYGNENTDIMIGDDFFDWWMDLYETVSDLEDIDDLSPEEKHVLGNYGDADDFVKIVKEFIEARI